ncbi:hypothetical protein Acy02nite_34030 [Actinoplanes cyaneus]|uniref:Immunity protein Imm1 n=1 Tax=Actinoplanes cyaneus TaxID=52696 RepID=A0A919IJJ0_9ACTN|nr:Imm1 family immunity protein [Actinoplanes cyaneus]MCW2140207.1 Immunity protein Imm1 [Actinoplanes cyaneus]GID65522.1 hypothetical protein Acy02nite_34030 [Actinoplanes cyaneus]
MSSWHFAHESGPVTGEGAVTHLRERVAAGELETWLRHDDGRMLGVVTNGNRAMVMAMDEFGDPSRHAVDPDANGEESGYRLSNGQVDRYDNRDTIPLGTALDVVRELIDHGRWPAEVAWQDDRN